MPGRKFTAGNGYRYGFNGKENDNEVKGEGNQQDYGMRVYDPRLGKFLSVDPLTKTYPMLTPYQFASNRPLDGIDLDGLEHFPITGGTEYYTNPITAIEMFRKNPDFNLVKKMASDDVKATIRNVQIQSMVLSFAGGSYVKFGLSAFRKALLGAATGSLVSAGFSYAKGDDGYEITRAAVSGLFSGALLASGNYNSFSNIIASGARSGIIGEVANQVFDKIFGNRDGADLEKMVISGGVGAVANLLSNLIVNSVTNMINNRVEAEIANLVSNSSKANILAQIRSESPQLGVNAAKKILRSRISAMTRLLKQQGELEKQAAKQAIERTIDYAQDKTNDKVKSN